MCEETVARARAFRSEATLSRDGALAANDE
jgi:hypothetical protein